MDAYRTPLRSRARVSKPQNVGARSQPWTASRCHRLLRPLISRIASLRREAVAASTHLGDATENGTEAQRKRHTMGCEWMAPRKKVRRTYAQRCADQQVSESAGYESGPGNLKAAKYFQLTVNNPAPGEIVAFTPLLRRARGQHVVSSPVREQEELRSKQHVGKSTSSRSSNDGNRVLEQRLTSLRTELSPARYSDYEGIFRALEALLRATRQDKESKGAISLLDMCLKKVPHYISEVEAWESAEAEKNQSKSMLSDSNTSFQIYTELESLGASSHGWRHLGTLARTDAVSSLKDAMTEGLFRDEFSMLLIDLCISCGATAESNGLMDVFVNRQYPSPTSSDAIFSENALLRPLAYLCDFKRKPDRPSFLLRQCSRMLLNGYLPVEWLVTREFERIWALANRTISREESIIDAVDFLVTSISLLCRKSGSGKRSKSLPGNEILSARRQTLTSALSILSAMSILGRNESQMGDNSSKNLERIAHVSRILNYTLQACVTEIRPWQRKRDRLGGDLLCMAAFFSNMVSYNEQVENCVQDAIETACRNLSGTNKKPLTHHFDAIVLLVSSVARICGHSASQASHDYLDTLCKQMGLLELQANMPESIAKAAAFSLAQQTNNVRDLIYAERLASNPVHVDNNDQGTGQTQSLFVGYRWEETIGEWVTASPSVLEKKPATKRQSLRSSTTNMNNDRDGRTEPSIVNAERSPTPACTMSSGLTSLVADYVPESPTAPGRGAEVRKASGRFIQTDRTGNPIGCSHQGNGETHTFLVCPAKKRRSLVVSNMTESDELAEDKENKQRIPRKSIRHGEKQRVPLGVKRRVRLSGHHHHSDDELSI